MTITVTEATARLRDLLQELKDGSWEPSQPERTCAVEILRTSPGTAPADALLAGMHMAGPGIAPVGEPNLFAGVLVQSSTLLRGGHFRQSEEGEQLVMDLYELLNAIVAPAPSWWARWARGSRDGLAR